MAMAPGMQARSLSVTCGATWPSVLACSQALARSLPSLGGEAPGGECGAEGAAATLRQVASPDPSHYPGYEPPLVQARARFRQRRRAEDGIADKEVSQPLAADA